MGRGSEIEARVHEATRRWEKEGFGWLHSVGLIARVPGSKGSCSLEWGKGYWNGRFENARRHALFRAAQIYRYTYKSTTVENGTESSPRCINPRYQCVTCDRICAFPSRLSVGVHVLSTLVGWNVSSQQPWDRLRRRRCRYPSPPLPSPSPPPSLFLSSSPVCIDKSNARKSPGFRRRGPGTVQSIATSHSAVPSIDRPIED